MSSKAEWYDHLRQTEANGGSQFHQGKLELIEWEFTEEDGSKLVWGGVSEDEFVELKNIFQNEFKTDLKQFFEYWPGAFRWTLSGEGTFFGCDHHNLGCTCDFCIQNKPLSDDAKRRNIFNYGLDLHFLK